MDSLGVTTLPLDKAVRFLHEAVKEEGENGKAEGGSKASKDAKSDTAKEQEGNTGPKPEGESAGDWAPLTCVRA
eukprot:scaffold98894_cov20-Tisochrysis_lutea.AAC.1